MNELHIAPGPVPSVRDGADIRDKACMVNRSTYIKKDQISMALAVNCICALLGDMEHAQANEIEFELRKGSILTVGKFSYHWTGDTKP